MNDAVATGHAVMTYADDNDDDCNADDSTFPGTLGEILGNLSIAWLALDLDFWRRLLHRRLRSHFSCRSTVTPPLTGPPSSSVALELTWSFLYPNHHCLLLVSVNQAHDKRRSLSSVVKSQFFDSKTCSTSFIEARLYMQAHEL